jgi:negative regulator of flagellin synthesis FlgM
MKITHLGPGVIDLYKTWNEKNREIKQEQGKPEQDRAEISPGAREILAYRAMLKEMPGIRQDKVEDIKARINNGTYTISEEKIAEGMIRERANQPPGFK